MVNRLIKIFVWSLLWLVFFWTFLIVGLPTDSAKDWLAERVGREINAKVSIEELRVRWNLNVKINGISINRGQDSSETIKIKLSSLIIEPELFSLIRRKPALEFNAETPSGGTISGSYDPSELSISFKDLSFKDISIAALPVPSGTSATGSGKIKLIKGKGNIEIEADGMPGGKQKFKIDSPGADGKIKITVSLPKI